MKYFYDTEFLEGPQTKSLLGLPVGKTPPTIDLISIGIVSEDEREYYAVSKEFNLKEAWNQFDLKINKAFPIGPEYYKVYWIRENILKPIYYEWVDKSESFTYKNFKRLLNKYGKTRKEIKKEVFDFVNPNLGWPITSYSSSDLKEGGYLYEEFEKHNVEGIDGRYVAQPEFYGYYADYDHVVLSWLFGKMIDLPSGFPMYTKDLKQMLDVFPNTEKPKQTNSHNALADAKWNFELYKVLEKSKYGAGRASGKTTKLVDEAIDFLFKNKFIYIADPIDIQKDFVGLNTEHRNSAKKFIDPDYELSEFTQREFKQRFVNRLVLEHKTMFTTKDNKLFKIK